MAPGRECPRCGTELPPGTVAAACPACLLQVGLDQLETAPANERRTPSPALPLGLAPQSSGAGEDPGTNHTALPETEAAVPSENAGDRVGVYKLLQQIGEGGMGTVWMAEQQQPYRRVALKLVKLGMDTKQLLARFRAEQQALALMDHPNIAKVFDPGATATGRPYFVMELVRGIPITRYCDQERLSTRARLELFIKVCQAVQHAHQKGVIHRDIKPSNILVTMLDGGPVPKIIDFGIAKATQGKLVDETLFTAFEQFIGTPAYMSPEQAEMNALDVDTRSDIYSLGVLLYELLTGQTPFDSKGLMASGVDEMRRTIREKEPARPSTRLSHLRAEELTDTARRRGMEATKLLRFVRGDLDWIVMKCLEKDRNRRYETANGLAMDLKRFLDNQPVVARPPSKLYRLRKLVRRNRAAFSAAALVVLSLVVGMRWEEIQRLLVHLYQIVNTPEAVIAEVNFKDKPANFYSAFSYDGERGTTMNQVTEEAGAGLDGGSALVAKFNSSVLTNRSVGFAGFGTTIGVSASASDWINTTNLGAYKLYVTAKVAGLVGTQSHGRIQWQFVSRSGPVLSMATAATFTKDYRAYAFVLADGYADPYSGGSWSEFISHFLDIDGIQCQLNADDWRGEYRRDIDAALYVANVKFVRLTRATGAELKDRAPVEHGLVPRIRVQPADQTICEGEDAVFSVLTSGTAPLACQWRKGSSVVPGATATALTLHHVTDADAGAYSISLTNAFGATTSRKALLKVGKLREVPIAEVNFEGKQPFYYGVYYYCPEPRPLLATNAEVVPGAGAQHGPALVGAVNGSVMAGHSGTPYAGFGTTIMVPVTRSLGIDTTNLGAYKLYVTAKTEGLAGKSSSGQVEWWFMTRKGVVLDMLTPVTFTTNYQTHSFVLRDGVVNQYAGGSWNEFVEHFDEIDRLQCAVNADRWLDEYRLNTASLFYVSNVKFVRLVPAPDPPDRKDPQAGSGGGRARPTRRLSSSTKPPLAGATPRLHPTSALPRQSASLQ